MEEDLKIYQGNAISDARYEMTRLEKDLIYMLLSKIKKQDRLEGKLSYKIHYKEFEPFLDEKITNVSHLRKATKSLIGRVYEIWQNDTKGKKVLLQTTFLSSARYYDGGIMELTINEGIQSYLMDFAKGFTVYSLQYAMSLKSIYSQRFYELLSQHRNLEHWRITIDELKYILKIEGKYPGYGMFKKKVLDTAQTELRDKTDINFSIKEIKKGRKVVEFIFSINSKDNSQSLEIEFDDTAKIYNRLVNDFSLAVWQAKQITQEIELKKINKELYAINLMRVNGEIKNVGGYTWKRFQSLLSQ